ncbi:universal stress protein [Pseudomonas japonica]|uniref:universal stress protein n=1 Tax=Pseudomonas japonica TaxID=256466 RepID=UPI0015E43603|nr:universal stress protein [Pseudomonas japonica]MBA1242760.1 universal stress protein [Pseudomonas japonica]
MNIPKRLLVVAPYYVGNDSALTTAVWLATAFDSSLHIIAFVYSEALEGTASSREGKERQRLLLERHQQSMQEHTASLLKSGLRVTCETLWEPPTSKKIVEYVRHYSADMVVKSMPRTTNGPGQSPGVLDWELLRACPAAVLLLKGTLGTHKLRCLAAIELAINGDADNAQNKEILRVAETMACECGGSAEVICVYDRSDNTPSAGSKALLVSDYEERKQRLHELAERFAIKPDRLHYVAGNPAREIDSFIERRSYDLLIVGAANPGSTTDSIGQTTHRLLEAVPCSVLVLKKTPAAVEVTEAEEACFNDDDSDLGDR